MRKINLQSKLVLCLSLITITTAIFAQGQGGNVDGKLTFLGVTHDSSHSVWLSTTTPGEFKLEAQGQQLIDSWDMTRRGIHLSLSPVVSTGNGGTHFLINRLNDKKLDQQNQKGGEVFPPFPSEPPDVTPPIPGYPEHPIIIPPGNPDVSPPIGGYPEHPIIIPPGQPPSIQHPIVTPPGQQPIITPAPTPTQPGKESTAGEDTQVSDEAGSEKPTPFTRTKTKRTKSKKTKADATCVANANMKLDQQVPITAARQFDQDKDWNVWSDNYYFDSNDGRHDLDMKGTTLNFAIGADRHITRNVVLGFLLSLIKYNYSAFEGDLVNRATGVNIGPYFGYRIHPQWSIDGSFTYGQLQNNNEIAILTSDYRSQLLHMDLRATGKYQFNNFQLRLKPLISFTHFRNPAYQLNGQIGNFSFQVDRAKENFNFNFVEFRFEGNYLIETPNGNLLQPYIEPGIDYAFARPNNGQILTGNLNLANTAPVTETLTVGIRTLIAKAFFIDLSGSYLSFGQPGLDVWQLRLLASYSFG